MIYKTTSLCYSALSKAGYFPLSSPSLVLCKTSLPHRRNICLSALHAFSKHTKMLGRRKIQFSSKTLPHFNTCKSFLGVCVFVLTTGHMMRQMPQVLPFQCMFKSIINTETILLRSLWPACKFKGYDRQAYPFNSCYPFTVFLCLFYTFHMLVAFVKQISPLRAASKKS